MKKRFTPAQIAFALGQTASGTPFSEITRRMGVFPFRKSAVIYVPGTGDLRNANLYELRIMEL